MLSVIHVVVLFLSEYEIQIVHPKSSHNFYLIPQSLHKGITLFYLFREGRVMGILEVSRSIGDGRFKHCGIINTPDVVKCPLGDNDW